MNAMLGYLQLRQKITVISIYQIRQYKIWLYLHTDDVLPI